jgi:hypothetical protein
MKKFALKDVESSKLIHFILFSILPLPLMSDNKSKDIETYLRKYHPLFKN